jgi:hypothetical protein
VDSQRPAILPCVTDDDFDAKYPSLTVYREFEALPAWQVVDRSITDLIENEDIEERTHHLLIVGYITKALARADLLRT